MSVGESVIRRPSDPRGAGQACSSDAVVRGESHKLGPIADCAEGFEGGLFIRFPGARSMIGAVVRGRFPHAAVKSGRKQPPSVVLFTSSRPLHNDGSSPAYITKNRSSQRERAAT